MFQKLIPKIFYDRLQDGLDFFVEALGFGVDYRDATMAVVSRDGAKAYLVESPEYAAKDRPELAIETDDVDAVYREMAARAAAAASRCQPGGAQALGCARVRDARRHDRLRELPPVA